MSKNFITLYQKNVMNELPREADDEYDYLVKALNQSTAFILPEYFSFHNRLSQLNDFIEYSGFTLNWLKDISALPQAKETLIIGGSILAFEDGELYNATPIIYEGKILAYYQKRRLFGHEQGNIKKGKKPLLIEHPGTGKKWGILICADVFMSGAFKQYEEADYIAVPTSSPYRPQDTVNDQNHRDQEIFVNGAASSQALIFKCCSVGSVGDRNPHGGPPAKLQGRSIICDQNKILAKAPNIYWSGLIKLDLSNHETNLEKHQEISPHPV